MFSSNETPDRGLPKTNIGLSISKILSLILKLSVAYRSNYKSKFGSDGAFVRGSSDTQVIMRLPKELIGMHGVGQLLI